uniref:AWS domain-containing protein n=1 Tax=Lutzomyia longipalpis TaxID=7200 RepID=A0A1B0GKA3_LUTLO
MPQIPGTHHLPPTLPESHDMRTRSWSYLQQLHGDPTSLPSTVDVNALKSGPSDNITSKNMDTSSSSSESDGSSSSSDSESSTTSEHHKRRKSPVQTPQFSVTSSDKSGLKMKIAAIPRGETANPKLCNNNSSPLLKANDKKAKTTKTPEASTSKKSTTEASSTSSCCSACDDSESDSSSDENTNINQQKILKKQKKIRRKKTSRSASTSSGERSDSSDSESSDGVLQEINPEDLAAILPNENFNEFETEACIPMPTTATSANSSSNTSRFVQQTNATNVPSLTDPGVDGSSSDMELPAIVNAAIERVENCSDSEVGGKLIAPPMQYNSPLLLDFMVKTQMLGKTATSLVENHSVRNDGKLVQSVNVGKENGNVREIETHILTASSSDAKDQIKDCQEESKDNVPVVELKRKRGRPKKNPTVEKHATASKGTTTTSGSPDSGILSITQSPSHSPRTEAKRAAGSRNVASGSVKKVEAASVPGPTRKTPIPTSPTKINIASLEKSIYATERVLYPPRGRRRGPGRPPTKSKEVKKEETIDPAWRKIDINKKFRRPSVSGYKSDGGTVCSKILASQSGYTSDYGIVRKSRMSGYRSDFSTKSKKSGYRSDYSVKAKSCGYRSDCSIRHRKKVRRKRRTKTHSNKSAVTEQDILQLAGLSLGQSSEENSLEANTPASKTSEKLFSSFNAVFGSDKKLTFGSIELPSQARKSLQKVGQGHSLFTRASNSLSFKDATSSKSLPGNAKKLTDFIGKIKSMSTFGSVSVGKPKGVAKRLDDGVCSFGSFLQQPGQKIKENNALKTPSKAAAIRSRRSSAVSRCSSRSTMSRHYLKRRRRKRLQSRNDSVVSRVTDSKFLQELDQLIASFGVTFHISVERNMTKESVPKSTTKRATKKRKVTETADSPSTSSGKRRNKKAQSSQSPDEHKLPLKKRHYLLTPGERSESKLMPDEARNSDSGKTQPRAVTPKKRHLIEKQDAQLLTTDNLSSAIKSSNSPITIDIKTTDSNEMSILESGTNLRSRRSDIVTRKKNRLENLVSKMQASPSGESSSSKGRTSVISKMSTAAPPPGVFEPSIDLELQIPVSTIVIPSLVTKTEALDSPRMSESIGTVDTNESGQRRGEKVVEALLSKTAGQLSKRKRRKAINRTGFPSVKKRKKIVRDAASKLSWIGGTKEPQRSVKVQPLTVENVKKITENCDRVPKVGETADTFVERNSRPRLSVVSLERLQGKIPEEYSPTCMVINPCGLDRRVRKSLANVEVVEGKRQLRVRNRDESSVKKRDRDSSQDSGSVTTIAKKLKEEETAKGRDQSSDNEPLINLVKSNERKRTRKKAINALIDNLTPNEILPESAKRTRLQSEIEKKNKLEAEMQPVVKLESMENTAGIILSRRTTSRSSSTILLSSTNLERSPRPKSRMEVRMSPLVISAESPKDFTSRSTSNETARESPKISKDVTMKTLQKISLERNQDVRKELSKEASKYCAKDASKTVKEISKIVDKDAPVVATKENFKETQKEAFKVASNEPSKVVSKQISKEMPKISANETIKIIQKEIPKLPLKDPAKLTSNELPPDDSKTIERTLRYKRANSIAAPPMEGNIMKIQSKEKSKATNKEKNKNPIKTRTLRGKSLEKKNPDLDEMSLAKRQQAFKDHVNASTANTQKKSEKNKPQTVQKVQEVFPKNSNVAVNADILETKGKVEVKTLKSLSPQLLEELEQEPLPISEGPSYIPTRDESPGSVASEKSAKKPSKWKKKYLTAGLLSDTFKEDEGKKLSRSEDYMPPISLLPPPPYCERFLRKTQRDFLLPYDLWWANENEKLPGRNSVPSWNYKKIRTNVYIDVRANPRTDQPSCSCRPDSGCGDDCLNRVVYTECSIETCPCGDKCQNTKIQRHEYAPGIERYMTANKGWGVRTRLPIKKGNFIWSTLAKWSQRENSRIAWRHYMYVTPITTVFISMEAL